MVMTVSMVRIMQHNVLGVGSVLRKYSGSVIRRVRFKCQTSYLAMAMISGHFRYLQEKQFQ